MLVDNYSSVLLLTEGARKKWRDPDLKVLK